MKHGGVHAPSAPLVPTAMPHWPLLMSSFIHVTRESSFLTVRGQFTNYYSENNILTLRVREINSYCGKVREGLVEHLSLVLSPPTQPGYEATISTYIYSVY